MNPVSRHIAYLLLTCRKVRVPGLGTFSASYEKASFDSEYRIFYPSRIKIEFCSKESHNSKLLLDSLVRKLNIEELEANSLIKDFVKEVKLKLQNNNYCKLEDIGYLIDNKGNLILKDTFWKRNKFRALSSIAI